MLMGAPSSARGTGAAAGSSMRALPGLIRLFPVAVTMALAAAAPPAVDGATVRHVDRSDATCGGLAPCYGSIQAAVNAAQPGDTVQVRAGTYVEQVSITGKNAGARSEASRIVVQADPAVPPGRAVLHGPGPHLRPRAAAP